jgi:glycosyltransferase involved in cell wall biosynthesis
MHVASVSAVIPTFNDAVRLKQCLLSIVEQTSPPDEVIVCDDCSDDLTEEVVIAHARRTPSIAIRYVRLEHHVGVVGARNRGIREAAGQWIANCDSDDLWQPDKLERQRAFLSAWDEPPLTILGTHGYNVTDAGRIISAAPIGPTSVARYRAIRAVHNVFYMLHSSIVFPRAAFDQIGGYSSEYGCDDCDFFTRMSDIGLVLALSEPLVHYRKRLGSLQLVDFESKQEGRQRLRANRRRASRGLPALSAEQFRERQAASPALARLKRRTREVGTYHYRVGTVFTVNDQRLRGAAHLSLAAILDHQRTTSGLRRVLRTRRARRGAPAATRSGRRPGPRAIGEPR